MKKIKIMILATDLMPSYINATPGVDKLNFEILPIPIDIMSFVSENSHQRNEFMAEPQNRRMYMGKCEGYKTQSGVPNIIIVDPYTSEREANALSAVFPNSFMVSISTVDHVLVEMLPFIHRVFRFEKEEGETQLTTIEFIEWLQRNAEKIFDPQQKYEVEENKTTVRITNIIFDNLKKEHQKELAEKGAAKIAKALQVPQKNRLQNFLSRIFG